MNTSTIERVPSWYGVGTDVSGCKNDLAAILKKSGLDYTVSSKPVSVDGIGGAENFQAIVRDSDNKIYQIARKSYTLCQNEDAFSLINQLDTDVSVVQAGETANGLIYMIAKMPEVKVLNDAFDPYIIFQTSHTSEYGLRMAITPLRIVCQNQFSTAFGECHNTQTIKHTSSIHSQIEAANAVLTDVAHYMKDFSANAERLASIQLPVEPAVEKLFPIPEQATERMMNNIEEKRERFLSIYDSEDNLNFKGTAWGFMNAATDFITHRPIRNNNHESHFLSTTINPELLKAATSIVRNA